MSKKKRLHPDIRREELLNTAVELAKKHGYMQVTRDAIARHADVAMGLVTHYLGTMPQLRRAVMRAAIADEVLEIIGQGLAANDQHARKAPKELKQRATDFMLNR